MAYLNFTELQGNVIAPYAIPAEIAAVAMPPETGFSALEWSVVAIAQGDRLSSLNRPGRMAIALGSIFAEWRNPRLADPRLEALRRMAVLAWHKGYAVPVSEIRAFHAAGFTADQYETLLASISRGRAARTNRQGTLQ